MNPEIILLIIKFFSVGIISFLAILIMSKTRDPAWMTMVAGFLFYYLSIVYDLLVKLNVISLSKYVIFGIPLFSLLAIAIPALFFIIALLIMFFRKN